MWRRTWWRTQNLGTCPDESGFVQKSFAVKLMIIYWHQCKLQTRSLFVDNHRTNVFVIAASNCSPLRVSESFGGFAWWSGLASRLSDISIAFHSNTTTDIRKTFSSHCANILRGLSDACSPLTPVIIWLILYTKAVSKPAVTRTARPVWHIFIPTFDHAFHAHLHDTCCDYADLKLDAHLNDQITRTFLRCRWSFST